MVPCSNSSQEKPEHEFRSDLNMNSGLNGTQTPDLCNPGAVLYQLPTRLTGIWSLCGSMINIKIAGLPGEKP